jgi:hypothetical protein
MEESLEEQKSGGSSRNIPSFPLGLPEMVMEMVTLCHVHGEFLVFLLLRNAGFAADNDCGRITWVATDGKKSTQHVGKLLVYHI